MKRKNLILGAAVVVAATLAGCCHQQCDGESAAHDAAMTTILQRKSVRNYVADTAVAPETIQELLRAAMAAPSGMDVRPWRFVVLTDKSQYETIFAGNFNMDKYMQSSFVVVFCADTTVTRPPRENPEGEAVTTPNPMWRDDMGACVENFLIAVEAKGLGACWTACYPFTDRMEPIRAALQLPGQVVPYAVVPVGVPTGAGTVKDKWDEGTIHYNMW